MTLEEMTLEELVHITLQKCSETFNPASEGYYELTDNYWDSIQKLYNVLREFDVKYGLLPKPM